MNMKRRKEYYAATSGITTKRVRQASDDLLSACCVIAMHDPTRRYLALNDPMALKQLDEAIEKATGRNVHEVMCKQNSTERV